MRVCDVCVCVMCACVCWYGDVMRVVCMPCLQCESDLQKMKIERLRAGKVMENYIECFERKRTQDMKVLYHVAYVSKAALWHSYRFCVQL